MLTSEWINRILNDNKRRSMPLITQVGCQLAQIKISEAVSDSDAHYKVLKTIADNFPVSALTMMMDLSLEAEAFGSEIKFNDDEVPSILSNLILTEDEIEKLKIPSIHSGRIQSFIKTAEMLARSNYPIPVFACCIGPFSLASRLLGLTEILTSILIEPDIIHLLLQKCCEFNLNYFNEIKRTGVNGIIIAEPSSGMLSPESCDEFSSKYIKTIVGELQDDNFMIILHNCGNTDPLLESMQSTGAKGIHLGNKCDIQKALKVINKDRIVMGNVDPASVFRLASPEDVKKITFELLESTSKFNNFILSSGCDVPFHTPLENVRAFFDALDGFNRTYN